MKKAPITILILCIALIYPVKCTFAQDGSSYISYENASLELLKNNRTLKSLVTAEKMAQVQYNRAIYSTRDINTSGRTYIINNVEYFSPYDILTQMQMTKTKVLTPEKARIEWVNAINNRTVTQQKLLIGLRDLYLALLNADNDLKLKQKKLDIAQEKHHQNILKYDAGLITVSALEESELSLDRAKKEVEGSTRKKENACRNLNYYIGVPINNYYSIVEKVEENDYYELKPVSYYIESALSKRAEIVSIEENIKYYETEIEILKMNNVYNIYRLSNKDIRDEYENAMTTLDTLRPDFEKKKYEIECEIKQAYIDIMQSAVDIEALRKAISLQKARLNTMVVQQLKGTLSDTAVQEYLISIEEKENLLRTLIYSINTKIMKLEYASGLGPAY